jgi:hypothetical protein
MKTSKKLSASAVGMCLALILSVPAVSLAAGALHFEKETLKAYEGQLRRHEVHADSFHPGAGASTGHLHISLNDGRHMTVSYIASEQARLVAQAHAGGTRVTLATVKHKAVKPAKHKLRYIAGGILVLVIVVVLIVLLIGRRRDLASEQPGDEAVDRTSTAPPAGSG